MNIPVGVDERSVDSHGADVDCTIVVTGGFYAIRAYGLDDGWTYVRVGCNPSGTGGDTNAYGTGGYNGIRVYLASGVCTMRVWAEWNGRGTLTKE